MTDREWREMAEWCFQEMLLSGGPGLADLARRNWERLARVRPQLGRWAYCKVCCKNVKPDFNTEGSLVICTESGCSLAPADEVCRFGSFRSWYDSLVSGFCHRRAVNVPAKKAERFALN